MKLAASYVARDFKEELREYGYSNYFDVISKESTSSGSYISCLPSEVVNHMSKFLMHVIVRNFITFKVDQI